MQIIFSNRAYNAVVSESNDKINTETGGVFLGRYENEIWYVVETIAPGPNAIFRKTYFEYDQQYAEHQINKSAQKYQADLTLIGIWHKHLSSFNEFTSTDDSTNSEYAKLSANGAISVLVNTIPDFLVTPYHVSLPLRYTKINYVVGDSLFPAHLLRLEM
jgi:integrative and conjugative element protein (TIGR02256 family)